LEDPGVDFECWDWEAAVDEIDAAFGKLQLQDKR